MSATVPFCDTVLISHRAKFFRLVMLFVLKALSDSNIFIFIFIKNVLIYRMHLILVCIVCINKISFSESK